ncbi:hypothetical protein [Bradyrhizobium sp. HKCCYLS20291]|uniref:hypothetical protein n=1 Tax=Bradyrhizobium sp. HKCCYLS20291 TaxID=3420766 RepID=UPI003EB9C772
MRRKAAIALALTVLFPSIGPAVAGLGEVKVVMIEVVDDYDQADVSPMGHQPRPMIKVTLSSDEDLRDYTRRGFHVGVNVGVCLEGSFTVDETKNLSGVYVYDASGNINDHRELLPSGASEYIYHFYFNVAFKKLFEPAPGQLPSFSWDMRTQPEDVCFKIRGGTMLGTGFAKDPVVIPATEITDAIARGERSKRGVSAKKKSAVRDRR